MVTQIFGDVLFYPQKNSLTEFPSPESLKNRIIISTKPPNKRFESNRIKDNDNCAVLDGSESSSSSEEESWGKESQTEEETEGTVRPIYTQILIFVREVLAILSFQQALKRALLCSRMEVNMTRVKQQVLLNVIKDYIKSVHLITKA